MRKHRTLGLLGRNTRHEHFETQTAELGGSAGAALVIEGVARARRLSSLISTLCARCRTLREIRVRSLSTFRRIPLAQQRFRVYSFQKMSFRASRRSPSSHASRGFRAGELLVGCSEAICETLRWRVAWKHVSSGTCHISRALPQNS